MHLGHRLPAEVGDPVGRLGDALVGDRRAERLGLDDDQADVVGDDVVQLLRDPHALLGHRALGQQLALAVDALGPLVQRVERGAPGGEVEAEGDRRRALHGEGRQVAEIDRMPAGDASRALPATSTAVATAVVRHGRVEAIV